MRPESGRSLRRMCFARLSESALAMLGFVKRGCVGPRFAHARRPSAMKTQPMSTASHVAAISAR